jgi:hypothetical protein
LPYLRLPFEALLFVPLTIFPYPQAYVGWDAFNIFILAGALVLLRRQIPILQRYPQWLTVLIGFAFSPVFLTLIQGQDSILLIVAYVLAYSAIHQGAEFRAGCCLGLGMVKPQLVLPFVLIALLRRKTTFVLGFLAATLLLLLISLKVSGGPAVLDFPQYIWQSEMHAERLVVSRDTPNLRGLFEGNVGDRFPSWVPNLLTGAMSIALLLYAGLSRRPEANSADRQRVANLAFCQSAIATVLVSYHAFAYDLGFLLVPMFVLLSEMVAKKSTLDVFARLAMAAPVVFLFFGPIYSLLGFRFHAMNFMAIILLWWMWGVARLSAAPPPSAPVGAV